MKKIKHIAVFFLSIAILCINTEASAQAKSGSLPQGVYRTIFEMLKDVPGLDVKTSNGQSGGTITIRGMSSLQNQRNPLIVVDGTIYGGNISAINPQDVEGISVLKDAASATAYGAQGSAGVILITTKRSGSVRPVPVESHNESAYTYFIDHKTKLKVFDHDEKVIVEGVIHQQRDSLLVFKKRKTEILVPIKNIKRVEMMPAD
jgi:TonB-dependent SusC/RagA subfamily outer membrane receptor